MAGCLAAEKKIKLAKLPPAVQKTVQAETAGGSKLAGVTKETEDGKTVYEIETKLGNGRTRDLTVDAFGSIVSVEEEVSLAEIPAAARAAIERLAGDGVVTKVESVTKGPVKTFEATIYLNGKNSEVTVTPDGKAI